MTRPIPDSRTTVMFVVPFVFPHKFGGVDTILLDTLRHIDRGRYRVIVVLPRLGGTADGYRRLADQMIYLDPGPLTKFANPLTLLLTLLSIPVKAIRLTCLIREHHVNIVHTQTELVLSSGLAARLAGIRSIYTIHNCPSEPRDVVIWDVLTHVVAALANQIIVVSRTVQSEFNSRGVAENKVLLIYNGVDTANFKPISSKAKESIRREFLHSGQQFMVGMMGRLHPSKGMETFLRAAATMHHVRRDIHFVVVGTVARPEQATYENHLRQLASELGLNDCLTFAGFRSDIPEVLSAFDVFLFPSIREPFGLALAEAMAAGCPVVASNSGGVPEVVRDGLTGWLVPPGNSADFATATLTLLDDPFRRRALGNAARAYIESYFSIERHVSAIEAVYEAPI